MRRDLNRTGRWLIGGLSLGLAVFTGILVKTHIQPYNITSVLAESDPVRMAYQAHLEKYNDENDIFLLLESEKPFAPAGKGGLYHVAWGSAELLKSIPGIQTVSSLDQAEYIEYDFRRDRFYLTPYFSRQVLTDKGARLLKDDALYGRTFVDPSGRALMVYSQLRQAQKPEQLREVMSKLDRAVRRIEATFPGVKAHLLGTEVARLHFMREMIKSQAAILPLVVLIIMSLIFWLFRSWKICGLSAYIMGVSYFLTVCLIIFLDGSINPFSAFALLFIFIISTADLVHLFTAITHKEGGSFSDRVSSAVKEIYVPCFVCALTTWIGLLSLVVSDLPPIRYFGIYCAFGVATCFFLTFHFLPFFFKVFCIEIAYREPPVKLENFPVIQVVKKYRGLILASFFLVCLGFTAACTKLRAGDNLYNKFVPSHPLSQAVTAFERYFQFTGSIDITLQGKGRDSFREAEREVLLSELANDIRGLPNVAHVKSVADYLGYIRSIVPGREDTTQYSFRDDKPLRRIHDLLEDFSALDGYLPPGENETRLVVYLKSLETETLLETERGVRALLSSPRYESFQGQANGFSTIRSAIYHSIYSGFVNSFLLDLAGIFLCFLIYFRSLRWAILALIPNILPLVAVGGLMAMLGITVEYNLIVLVALILGITVDDTTHFLHFLIRSLKEQRAAGREPSMEEAVRYSLRHTSSALLGTTFIFVVTVPTFFLTDILMFSQVALVLMLSMIIGLAGDMYVLPALLFSPRKRFFGWLTDAGRVSNLVTAHDGA